MADYDYIIVGGGSAGCVLAARLSEDPDVRVLLLEAGGRGRSLFIRMPAANGFLFGRHRFDWGYRSEPQAELDGRQIYYPRGRGLGGSSAINGMIYIRGNPRDYDGWRQLGLAGWGYADLLPYFKRSESNPRRDDDYRGGDGPLANAPAANFGALDRAFLEAAQQAGLPFNPDFNGVRQVGVGVLDVTVRGGERVSVAAAYLEPAERRPNLSVLTGAFALALVTEGTRVRGLRFERDGRVREARAVREVVVSLGAFASPQLLMLSGLGPAEELRRLDIPVVADLPGVGRNLQDHLNITVQRACTDERLTLVRYQRLHHAAWLGLRYLLARRGPGAAPFWSAGAFKPLGDEPELPDLQLFFTPMLVVEDPTDERNVPDGGFRIDLSAPGRALLVRGKHAVSGFQIDANMMRPESRGRLTLRSADPRVHPVIDPGFLTSERDRRIMIDGVKTAREIFAQPAFEGLRGAELLPGPAVRSDAEILACVRQTASCAHHPIGTCKMGRDDDRLAVVDGELKVRGVEGLRVVDASVMPVQITGNTNAPVVMIAEKAADMIRGRPAPPRANL